MSPTPYEVITLTTPIMDLFLWDESQLRHFLYSRRRSSGYLFIICMYNRLSFTSTANGQAARPGHILPKSDLPETVGISANHDTMEDDAFHACILSDCDALGDLDHRAMGAGPPAVQLHNICHAMHSTLRRK